MFDIVKRRILYLRPAVILVGAFFVWALASVPVSTDAQCPTTWDGSGEWEIRAMGPAYPAVVKLNLEQSGAKLIGTASRVKSTGVTQGTVTGKVAGASFTISISWLDHSDPTIYTTPISAEGELEYKAGINYWHSNRRLTCGSRLDRSKRTFNSPELSGNAPVQTGSSLLKGPVLVASQAVFPTPYTSTGFVVLTWDAGPDHPDADLWFKSGRDRVLLMKQPKGGQQVVVQRGQMYEYLLMDGRIVLAAATFVAQ